MDDQQKNLIKEYAKKLNNTITDNDLLDFVVDLTVDRVLIYLNEDKLNPKLNRVVAQAVVGVYNKTNAERTNSGAPEQAISSISDNGQSVSYSSKVKSYLGSASDDELFNGFESLLKPYRRVNVVS
jgi:hypothetical protein|nr:MAG TPA: Head Tail Connector Protein [Caudoviricetes sp.]